MAQVQVKTLQKDLNPDRPHISVQVKYNLILLSTNKGKQNKSHHIEGIVSFLTSTVVCYRH